MGQQNAQQGPAGPPPVTFRQRLVGDASIAYSGGLDSTFVAYTAAATQGRRVHLHTLDHGFGYLFNSWAAGSARSLARTLPEGMVTHRFVRTGDLFRRLAVRSLLADRRRYGQWFGCCLGCTMAVVTKMVIYNLERGIPHLMFGSSVGGQYAVMSMPATIERQKEFCGNYGLVYSAPLLDNNIVKATERSVLEAAGVRAGILFHRKHSFGNQGYCLPSLQHLPDVIFNVHPTYDPEQVARFYRDKEPVCREYIERHFARTGRDLQAAVAAMRKLTAGADR